MAKLKDGDGLPIIIAVKANQIGDAKYYDVTLETKKLKEKNDDRFNLVASEYGKDDFFEHINDVINQDALLYANKNKTLKLFSDRGLYLPTRLNSLGFDKIIHQSRNIVNTYSMQNSENNAFTPSVSKADSSLNEGAYDIFSESAKIVAEKVDNLHKFENDAGKENAGKKYSIKVGSKEEIVFERSFAEQVKEVLSPESDITDGNNVFVCKTPNILKQLGFPDLPMLITKGHLRDIHHEEVVGISKYHGLSEPEINRIPEVIEKPAIVFKTLSENNTDAICILSHILDSKSRPMLVAIKMNGDGRYNEVRVDTNFILSAYGRNNAQGYLDQLGETAKNVIYMDKKRTQEMLKGARLQLPAGLSNLKFNSIIHKIDNVVNAQSMQNSENNAFTPSVSKADSSLKEGAEVKRSIKMDSKGNPYWLIESNKDIFKGLSNIKELKKAAYDYILKSEKGEIINEIIDGQSLKFTRISAKEYVYGSASKTLDSKDYKKKMRMAPSITDLIENAFVEYETPDHKNHKFAKDGFRNYRGRVRLDNVIFSYIVRVGVNDNQNMFYDINLEVESTLPSTNVRQGYKSDSTSTDNISQKDKVVNTQSMQKAENNSQRKNSVKMGDDIKSNKVVDDTLSLEYNDISEFIPRRMISKSAIYSFLSDKESWSEAGQLAIRWANKEGVETGAQTVISYHNQWYVVEKFDSAEQKYQIVGKISSKNYNIVLDEVKKREQLKKLQTVQGSFNRLASLYEKGDKTERRGHGTGDITAGRDGKDNTIQRMGREQNGEWTIHSDSGRSNERDSSDREDSSLKNSNRKNSIKMEEVIKENEILKKINAQLNKSYLELKNGKKVADTKRIARVVRALLDENGFAYDRSHLGTYIFWHIFVENKDGGRENRPFDLPSGGRENRPFDLPLTFT